jgi:hypothetical protein
MNAAFHGLNETETGPLSVPHECSSGFLFQVDESFTGDVENHFFNGGSGELPGPFARVVLCDRVGPIPADIETLA